MVLREQPVKTAVCTSLGRMALPSLDDYLGTLGHLKQIKDIAEIGRVGYTCDLLSAKKAQQRF
jgi:hypothetical protein